MVSKRVILGIDPGTQVLGWGVIEIDNGSARFVSMGIKKLSKESDHFQKLASIFEEVTCLINRYSPNVLSVEAPFYGKNIQSMLKLGRAQGAAIAAALNRGLPVFEYAPRRIKQSITGKGAASKEQVASVMRGILKFNDMPESLDATDGLAVALCHFFSERVHDVVANNLDKKSKTSKANSWGDFVKNNPQRLK